MRLMRLVCVVILTWLLSGTSPVIKPAQAENVPLYSIRNRVSNLTLELSQYNPTDSAPGTSTPFAVTSALTRTAYLPFISRPYVCPTTSSAQYEAISFLGSAYKYNAITDENADFRLSILGYVVTSTATLDYVNYGGGTGNGDGPQFADMFTPKRKPAFLKAYQVYQWIWSDGPGSVPPYGTRGALNTNWAVTVLELATTPGEPINIPARNAYITGNYTAHLLYAGPSELTVVYLLQDQVVVNGTGYVVHMLNFCVDPNLLALYRAQLSNGYRSTMKLPAIRNNQAVGKALGNAITVAVRDGGAFMDPRVKTDWWYDAP